METEWLQAAGLGSLAAPFQAGLEVTEAQLGEAVRPLPREQAAAVRRRVRRLNRTVRRKRAASRARKPDIRDVFRDLEVSVLLISIGGFTIFIVIVTRMNNSFCFT